MFYPAQMNKVTIGVHRSGYETCMASLYEAGILEISDIRDNEDKFKVLSQNVPHQETLNRVITTELRIGQILEKMHHFAHTHESIITEWFSPPHDTRISACDGDASSICSEADQLINELSEFLSLCNEFEMTHTKKEELEASIEVLSLLLPLDLNPESIGSFQFSEISAGIVATTDLEMIQDLIESSIPSELLIKSKQIKEWSLMVVATSAHYRDQLLELLRPPQFKRIISPANLEGKPSLLIPRKQSELNELLVREEDLINQLSLMAEDWLHRCEAVHEDLSLLRTRLETARKCGKTRDVVIIRGWIRKKDLQPLSAILYQTIGSEFFITVKEPDASDSVPIRYDNPSWLAPFEFLTTMFAPPRYNEIDPTPFIAPVFLLFFGLMLGDAGYGLVILLIGFLLYRGAGQKNKTIKDMCIVLMGCALADIICGTLQGGWFGDILPRFFGISSPFVLIDPMRSPIQFFQIALIIGIIHINLGIFLGFWQNYKKKRYRQAVQEQIIWYIIEPCAAVMLVQFFGWMTIPSWITILAGVMIMGSFGILFLNKGPMGFFSVTGFLGDWLSYVRILALALATGGIAMTINLLAEMIALAHPLLLIPAIIFLILGQTFNLVIQTLGSVIHALRLHYIEFFGKFYMGGGRPFHPFKAERVHTVMEQSEVIL